MTKVEAAKILGREIEAKLVAYNSLLKEAIDECESSQGQCYATLAQTETLGIGLCLEAASGHLDRAAKFERAEQSRLRINGHVAQPISVEVEEEVSETIC